MNGSVSDSHAEPVRAHAAATARAAAPQQSTARSEPTISGGDDIPKPIMQRKLQ